MSEQISIFDEICIVEDEEKGEDVVSLKEAVSIPYIGQKVKIKLPEDKDSEEYQYLYYYCSSFLNKIGEVKEMKLYPSGNYTCTIDYFGDTRLLNPENLILL